jgi:hypothetical protein
MGRCNQRETCCLDEVMISNIHVADFLTASFELSDYSLALMHSVPHTVLQIVSHRQTIQITG